MIPVRLRSATLLLVNARFRLGVRCVSTSKTPLRSEQNHEDQSPPNPDLHENTSREDETRQIIFHAALKFVPEYGWSRKALVAGTEAEGLSPALHGLFPRGASDLVDHFYKDCNAKLFQQMQAEVEAGQKDETQKKKVSRFIRDAVEVRLRMITPYIVQWPQAMGIMALPQNALGSLQNLSNLMDDIWFCAGDTSTDVNWYTKRITLAAAYKSTELYMLQDKTEEFKQTWLFLDRRLSDLATVGKTIRQMQNTDACWEGLRASLTVTKNMVGFNSRVR